MTQETRVGMLVGLVLIVVFGLILAEFTGTDGPPRTGPPMTGSAMENSGHAQDGGITSLRGETRDAPSGARYHEVSRGETLISIARRYYGRANEGQWRRILQANRSVLRNGSVLPPGAKLVIPAPVKTAGSDRPATPRRSCVYVVKSRDTLTSIARRMMGDASSSAVRKLYEANKSVISSENRLVIGTELVIPQ